MNEEHLAKVNSKLKSKEKIHLSKWREQACFWRQNSNYHRKWRKQACFICWCQISNSNRMRNIRRNGARSEADLAQLRRGASFPFLFFLWLLVQFSSTTLLRALEDTLRFRRWKRSRALSRRCHRPLATCQAMHGDLVTQRRQGPVERRRTRGAAQGSNLSASTPRIRFLEMVVFSVLSTTFSGYTRYLFFFFFFFF